MAAGRGGTGLSPHSRGHLVGGLLVSARGTPSLSCLTVRFRDRTGAPVAGRVGAVWLEKGGPPSLWTKRILFLRSATWRSTRCGRGLSRRQKIGHGPAHARIVPPGRGDDWGIVLLSPYFQISFGHINRNWTSTLTTPLSMDNKNLLGRGRDLQVIWSRTGKLMNQIANFEQQLKECEERNRRGGNH